jgi:hypothetical protein
MFKNRKESNDDDESLDAISVKYKSELDQLSQKFPQLKDDPILLYRFIRARPTLKQSADMIADYLVQNQTVQLILI